MNTALVVGATGLVGSELVAQLLADEHVDGVVTLVRRPSGITHERLVEHVVRFDDPASWVDRVEGDVLYCALGTTINEAGGEEAQRRIDYDLPLEIATAAVEAGVTTCVAVSSAGADPESRLFYLRTKGELERELSALAFRAVHLLRPGLLDGKRDHTRPMERSSVVAMRVLGHLPGLHKYRPIAAEAVARAMRHAAERPIEGTRIYEPDEVFTAAEATSLSSGV